MKETTKLLIQSGVIPESVVRLCQIWQGDSSDLQVSQRSQTEAELQGMVTKIAELLEKDALPDLKETELDLNKLVKEAHLKGVLRSITASGMAAVVTADVAFTVTGDKLVIATSVSSSTVSNMLRALIRQGAEVLLSDGREVEITSVEPRYIDSEVSHYVCGIHYLEVNRA